MARFDHRFLSTIVAIGLIAGASLSLAACGRKGPLEAPPANASGVTRQPGAPTNPDRHFILDPLL